MTQHSDTCPVCGMNAEVDVPSVEHHKMYFHFCSEQCRETFVAHPGLYWAKEEGQEPKEILKRRAMHLAEPLDTEVVELLIPYLSELMGVKEVVIEGDNLLVTYDLLQIKEIGIEKALAEVGIQLGGDWLERFSRGWVHDCEDNQLDNLAAPPEPLPNRAPPGAGSK